MDAQQIISNYRLPVKTNPVKIMYIVVILLAIALIITCIVMIIVSTRTTHDDQKNTENLRIPDINSTTLDEANYAATFADYCNRNPLLPQCAKYCTHPASLPKDKLLAAICIYITHVVPIPPQLLVPRLLMGCNSSIPNAYCL